MRVRASVAAVAFVLASAAAAAAEVPVPPLGARVTDPSGTLTPTERAALERRLRDFETSKGSQIAILILPTTEPETIEQYAIRVADAWKLGRKGVDDGALLVVATGDRHLRIEVGYGLEGVLPDVVAHRIIDETIVPQLRAGRLYDGIREGVERMIAVIEGEPLPPPARRQAEPVAERLPLLLLLGLLVVPAVALVCRTLFGRLLGAVVVGTATGLLVWVLLASFALALMAGFLALFYTLAAGLRGGPRVVRSGRGPRGRGYGGYPGFPGGGDFDIFRGGGGRFGGGGASGRW